MMKVLEHEHPLKLFDLQVNDEDVEESADEGEDEKDMVKQDEFSCTCNRCSEDINVYHRYYYKCMDNSCDFYLHKFCAEVPTTLKHMSHPHPVILANLFSAWTCNYCEKEHKNHEVQYFCNCSYLFTIDVNCGVEVDKKRIYHPCHPHPLVPLLSKPILCDCSACGKEHKGVFLRCTTCSNFAIHSDCAFLPKRLLIQQTTNGNFSHIHQLTLSYSFPLEEQDDKYRPRCRVCNDRSLFQENLWIYKCEKCIYYVHLDCATARKEPFMSILSIGKTHKNFKDVDYPDLVRLPFPDQTCSIPKHLLFKELGATTYDTPKVSLQHTNHHHELILVNKESIGSTSSKINSNTMLCHNPKKKIEVLCNACIRPIMEMPFYKCRANEDESCNFALHEWCTRLPAKLDNHPGHSQHTLVLTSNVPNAFYDTFSCGVCFLPCNGYAYGCGRCEFYTDITCGLMPEKITHKSHPNHLLSISKDDTSLNSCHMCHGLMTWDYFSELTKELSYSCKSCDVYIHPECALFSPETIMHPYDKHPLHLSYLPIENHKSEYFCEICENILNPHDCFYHCDVCAQSMHSACAPLILQCERETLSRCGENIYLFLNVKFGSIHKTDGHPHPLSFEQGIESDGECSICAKSLLYKLILRCLECKFAIHQYCLNT